MSIRLRISGEYACFTRPEMKVERVSYDVITPSAAVGVLDAIYWKPAIRWFVKKIEVLKPIRFQPFRTNEIKPIAAGRDAAAAYKSGDLRDLGIEIGIKTRTQRTSLLLVDVDYIIEADFIETGKEASNRMKHESIFNRRAENGQCFQQPSLGLRQFTANFQLLEPNAEAPTPIAESRDLGFMLHHIDHETNPRLPAFFRASMENGVINVPRFDSPEVVK